MNSSVDFERPLPIPDPLELDRELTPYHEAGHALGYADQGRELLSVSIIETPAYRGWTSVVPARVPVQDVAIVAALGPIAEAIHAERTEPDLGCDFEDFLFTALWNGGDSDFKKSAGRLEGDVWVNVLRDDLLDRWHAVERLAEALLQRGLVPGSEALALLFESSPGGLRSVRRRSLSETKRTGAV